MKMMLATLAKLGVQWLQNLYRRCGSRWAVTAMHPALQHSMSRPSASLTAAGARAGGRCRCPPPAPPAPHTAAQCLVACGW